MTLAEDIKRLHVTAVDERPDRAIYQCVGFFNTYPETGHKTFVVKERVVRDGREERVTTAEFATLDEALNIGALPWGSSTVCQACIEFSKRKMI